MENYIVGAPCGVMDQMASALGQEGALMAMSCQPAEVEPEVPIPPHLKFWGLDSGPTLPACSNHRHTTMSKVDIAVIAFTIVTARCISVASHVTPSVLG